MSNLTIAYNGSTIFDGELEGAITLPTAEKYLEGDIVIAGEGGGTVVSDVLEENEWSVISEVAQAGEGGNYWSVGDAKKVHLQGTVGTLSLNTDLYVYIIGINHRGVNGITFQGFKTAQTNGTNVCLVSSYNTRSSSGALLFNMNHWGTSNNNGSWGGWKGCDLRYDILGSTAIAPNTYGQSALNPRVGYDAGPTTATNPKSNTLLSCFPADLRAVMQPMTVYTNNSVGGSNDASNISTSVDYLPLLAEYEVYGVRSRANVYEQQNQSQYAYYSTGNTKVMYQHSAMATASNWWERSPDYYSSNYFCYVLTDGTATSGGSRVSFGVAPMFLV